MRRTLRLPALLAALGAGSPAPGTLPLSPAPAPLAAQESRIPPAIEASLLLRQMDGVKRVLVIGAHPDDEDTSLLALLARGWGAEAAYFSFTRGEGGQNLIGPELDEGLGIVRTGEILSARELDGGDQFFSRAYDYGYSKSADEAFRHWPRDELLADLVWVIRRFRPHVLVSIFGGTPADGHGQHQAAGLLARDAFEAAGDPDRFPEQLRSTRAWAAHKLYRRAWWDPESATLDIPAGRIDPLLGRSAFQLAMESRSRHRSQDFGTAQPPGPRDIELDRLADRTGTPASAGLFAGIDTTLASLVHVLPNESAAEAARHLERYRSALDSVAAALRAPAPEEAV
ncbi:MAG: PIG-L family deacetylase, partial [Gemmatimonadota bacterium]